MKIESIRTTPVLAPLPCPLVTASGRIEQFPLVIIDVTTDTGIVGRSYTDTYLKELLPALDRTISGLGTLIAGMPLAPRDVFSFLNRRCRLMGMKNLVGVAIGGLDMAIWDAWSRAQNVPLVRALGGSPRPIRAYNSLGLYDAKSVVAAAEETNVAGYAGMKVKTGFPTFAEDLACVRAARKALKPDVALMIDYNQSLDPVEAMARCRALDGEGLEWIEEPVIADDFESCARIASAVATPIQIGENFNGPGEMRAAMAANAMDLVMPDAQFIHGVSGWMEAATLARSAGIPMSSHLFPEASAHLLGVTPTAHWLEVMDVAGGLRSSPLPIVEGCVTAPEAPGFGIDWDDDAIARHRVSF